MLKLLLRLWWLQQRRNFHKRDAFVVCYIIFLYVMVGVGFYQGFTESGGELEGEEMPALLGAGIVIGMLIPDIIMKMVMKRDITAMDDYVKSRLCQRKSEQVPAHYQSRELLELCASGAYASGVHLSPAGK